MMRANELRIGNYYDFSHSGQIEQITGKDIYEFESDPIDDIYYPIPLTEEWLLRLGFKKENPKFNWYQLGKVTINIFNNEAYKLNTNGFTPYKAFKHVHQLQNLYFALTGEELTLEK